MAVAYTRVRVSKERFQGSSWNVSLPSTCTHASRHSKLVPSSVGSRPEGRAVRAAVDGRCSGTHPSICSVHEHAQLRSPQRKSDMLGSDRKHDTPRVTSTRSRPTLDFGSDAPGISSFNPPRAGEDADQRRLLQQQRRREERQARAEAAFQSVIASESVPRLSSPYKRAVRSSLDIHPPQVQDPGPSSYSARERRSPVHFSPTRQAPGEVPRLPLLPQHGSAVAHTARSSPPTFRRRSGARPVAMPDRSSPSARRPSPVGRSAAIGAAGGVQEALNNAHMLRAPDEAVNAGPELQHRRKKRKNAKKVLTSAAEFLSEARYHDASEAYLSALKSNPEDERMSHGFSEACVAFKMQQPDRWSRWPFSDGSGNGKRVYTGQKPCRRSRHLAARTRPLPAPDPCLPRGFRRRCCRRCPH